MTATAAPAPAPGGVLRVFPRRSNSRRDEVRVALSTLTNGTVLLDIRRWTPIDGRLCPTREGCAIKATELRDLEEAVRRARDLVEGLRPTPAARAPKAPPAAAPWGPLAAGGGAPPSDGGGPAIP